MTFGFTRVAGLALAVAGIILLFHPNIPMPAHKKEVELGPAKAIIETRRIVSVPKGASWVIIACGGVLLIFGGRRG